ncbi:MAG: hypothetical protein ACM34N_13085 [Ignavibacteria bacterium]
MTSFIAYLHYPLILFFSFLTFISCSENNPTEPEKTLDEYTLISSGTIGPNGGEITADELTINIPSSSFSSATEIKIYSSQTEKPFGENQISKTYKIDNLPSDYIKAIEIALKYSNGSTADKHFLVLGQETFTEGKIITTYSHIYSTDTNNVLTCCIPVPQQENVIGKTSADNQQSLIILSVNSLYYLSPGNHFAITSPINAEANSIIRLGDYLEEAYQKVLDLGFNYDERTNWPVEILIKDLGPETDAYTSCSWFGNNYGYIEFNTQLLNDLAKLRVTAGHEFFHLIQYLYDTRSGITKSGWASMHHWVNEAAAAWFEEKFSEIPGYTSDAILEAPYYSLDGMQVSPYDNNGKLVENFYSFCYGRAPIIKYLVNKYGEEIIIKIFNDIKNGKHPVEAVCQHHPKDWWEDFLKELILGNVYAHIPGDTWVLPGGRSDRFQVNSGSDTSHIFAQLYKDLSAKISYIQLSFPEVNSDAKAVFKISGAENRFISLFNYNTSSKIIEFISSNKNEIVVSDIKTMTQNNQSLIALVSNNIYTTPYNWDNEITLNFRIKTDYENPNVDGYYMCRINHFALYDILSEKTGSDGSYESEIFTSAGYGLDAPVYGNVENHTFFGSRQDSIINTTVDIYFNNSYDKIDSISVTHTIENNNEVGNFYHSIKAVNIPKSDWSDGIDCSIIGSSYCNSLQIADYKWTATYIDKGITYTRVMTTTGFSCNDLCSIVVTFYKQSL